jgi:hypothetical protein
VAPKANKEIYAARVDRCIELISTCTPRREILRVGREEWGLKDDMIDRYIYRARKIIREQYDDLDRKDWVAGALEKLEKVASLSIKSNQHSNAIGAIGLQAKLLQITNGN